MAVCLPLDPAYLHSPPFHPYAPLQAQRSLQTAHPYAAQGRVRLGAELGVPRHVRVDLPDHVVQQGELAQAILQRDFDRSALGEDAAMGFGRDHAQVHVLDRRLPLRAEFVRRRIQAKK